ncbi:hypothetical protein HRbin27_00931 [bacterium HR27]|nr:hypothetical protein HRbin27_00931 [bacterium HR27]
MVVSQRIRGLGRAPGGTRQPDADIVAEREFCSLWLGCRSERAATGPVPRVHSDTGWRPAIRREPLSRNADREAVGTVGILHEETDQRRIVGRFEGEPALPPGDEFVQEVDARTHRARVGSLVRPGADQPAARNGKAFKHAPRSVGVPVVPGADNEDRAGDRVVVGCERATEPVGIAALMAQPSEEPRFLSLEALPPGTRPVEPGSLRVRRQRVHRDHPEGITQEFECLETAAPVMHIGHVAVVAAGMGDDRCERCRTSHRDLECIERTVGGAPQADPTVAPRLPCEPMECIDTIGDFCLAVLIGGQAFRGSGATYVEPHGCDAVLCQRDRNVPARSSQVVLPVGEILDDGRPRAVVTIGQVHIGAEGRAVTGGDGDVPEQLHARPGRQRGRSVRHVTPRVPACALRRRPGPRRVKMVARRRDRDR